MPEIGATTTRLFEEGIEKLDSFLRQQCGAQRLPDNEASAVERRFFVAGWQLTIETPLAQRRLNVYIDPQFPLSIPRFVLIDRPPFPAWPHIEEDGLMCLPESRVAKFRHPEAVVGELLQLAYRLVRDCESDVLEDDFRTEFHTYWNRLVSKSDQIVRSLIETRGPSRIVHAWTGKTRPVVGESEQQVLNWLRNHSGDQPQFDNTEQACLLWVEKALLPSEYPKNAADIYRLASAVPGGKILLEQLAKNGTGPFYFVIGAESGNGPCLAAVRTARALSTDIRGAKRDRSCKGFRPGKVPPNLQAFRVFSSGAEATRLKVERVDAEWIHGRGRDPRQKELQSKRVVVFGCGSLGAPLAHQLGMAGVGHTVLVDPEDLRWPNVGRHPLGASYVDLNKALSLAAVLQKAYPHSEFRGYAMSSHDFLKSHLDIVRGADLIICAVADWKAELEFALLQHSGEITAPVLDVWTEENAAAGHAVVVFPAGSCLQCGFDLSGESKLRVTEWPEGKKEQSEPACGAMFQPYGPVEALGITAVAGTLALDVLLKKVQVATHRIWVGPERLLLEFGGAWTKQWMSGGGIREEGAFQEERVWERDPHCVVCGGGTESASPSFTESDDPRNASSSAPPC